MLKALVTMTTPSHFCFVGKQPTDAMIGIEWISKSIVRRHFLVVVG